MVVPRVASKPFGLWSASGFGSFTVWRGAVLYVVGCLAMSLPLPTRRQQNPHLPTQCDNHKRLQMLPDVPWGTKPPSVENYVSLPLMASCWEEEGVC